MDRRDEFDRNVENDEPATDERSTRGGDILGLGDVVPESAGDPSGADDPESATRRRERALRGDEERAFARTPERTSGATSIDMGAGGSGTQIDED